MKLIGSTKSKITKDENDENMPCLEITDGVLIELKAWFTAQSSKPLEIQDKTIIPLVINKSVKYKNGKIDQRYFSI